MKRREFIKTSSALALFFSSQNLSANDSQSEFVSFFKNVFKKDEIKPEQSNNSSIILEPKEIKKIEVKPMDPIDNFVSKDKQIIKSVKDVYIEQKFINEFISVKNKLKLIQNHVGYGNFNIISFDEMLKVARYSSKIKKFTKQELEFLETIFYYDPKYHGFYGERISKNITEKISKKDIRKIPRTGHYLFKGEPEKIYNQMVNDIGDSLVLTSGIRSIVKQTKLFLDKIDSVDGNLSVASKSLAPPAFTYHSIADFDVGKKGFGHANFTSRFALTQEFLKMRKLKYIDMRYTINNKDGVRYEPWHVRIV